MSSLETYTLNRVTFIRVASMLQEIGAGLGLAEKMLVDTSGSNLGTLAIKGAEVQVDFELTSNAYAGQDRLSADMPVLGAKTLTFNAEETSTTAINKASVRFNVVNVPYSPDEFSEETVRKFAALVMHLKAKVSSDVTIKEKDKSFLLVKIDKIDSMIKENRINQAFTALLEYMGRVSV